MSEDFNSPSDKNCCECGKVLTQFEKKTCLGRSSSPENVEFICNPCYTNRWRIPKMLPSEQEEYNRLTDLMLNSKTLTELEGNFQTVKNSPLYSSNKKTWKDQAGDNKTRLDKDYNSCKRRFCTSCLNHVERHQPNCSMKCKKCNHSILKEGDFRCFNLDCENLWSKHNNIPNVNPVDNNPNRQTERDRAKMNFIRLVILKSY